MNSSVKKALKILVILSANAEKPTTLKDLAQEADLNKSTCSHILSTLREFDFVEQVSHSKGYRLGPWAYMLSRYGRYQDSLVSTADPLLRWLHRRINTTIMLTIFRNGKKYIIYHIDEEGRLPDSKSTMLEGRISTASALLLMSFMEQDELNDIWMKNMNDPIFSDPLYTTQGLKKIRKKIQTQGYFHRSFAESQTQAYAFGIFKNGLITAALGIFYPDDMETEEYRKNVIKYGILVSKEITHRLEFDKE